MPATLQRPGIGSYESSGRAMQPSASAAGPSLRHAPNAPFLHMAHPGRWGIFETDRGFEILPQLGKMKLDRGVGGVTNTGDDSHARVHYQKLGWIIIELDFEPGYVREHDTNGGKLYTSKWEHPRMSGRTPTIRTDQEGWWAFLRRVADELLPEPDPEIIANFRDVLGARLGRQLEQAELRPSRAKAAEETQARIDALDALTGEDAPEAVPAPAKRAKKAKASEEVSDAD